MTDKAGYPQAAFGGATLKDEVQRLEALAVEYRITLEMIQRHDGSSFYGPEGKKHERAQWRGIMRRVRQVLAASMPDQHAEALRRLADK